MRRLAMRRFRQTVVSCEEAQIASILDAVNRGIPAPHCRAVRRVWYRLQPRAAERLAHGVVLPGR